MQRKRDLLIIEWEDTRTHGSWHAEDDIKLHSLSMIVSVGWRVPSAKKGCVSVAASRSFITDDRIDCADVTTIARSSITKMRKLE